MPSTQDRALARTIVRRAMAYNGGSSSGLIPGAAVADVQGSRHRPCRPEGDEDHIQGPAMRTSRRCRRSGRRVPHDLRAAHPRRRTAVTVSNISGEASATSRHSTGSSRIPGRHASMTKPLRPGDGHHRQGRSQSRSSPAPASLDRHAAEAALTALTAAGSRVARGPGRCSHWSQINSPIRSAGAPKRWAHRPGLSSTSRRARPALSSPRGSAPPAPPRC